MSEDASPPELAAGKTAGGLAIASLGGYHLHSRYDPVKEAERLAASPETESADLVVLCGFGLGYVVEALAARCGDRPVLVVEPDIAWVEKALQLRLDSQLPFSLPEGFRMTILKPDHPDHLIAALQEANCRKPGLLVNPAIARLKPDLAQLCRHALTRFQDRLGVNVNTLSKFGHLWVRNLSRNLDSFATGRGINDLAGMARGLPGLLLAGGPGLDLILPRLAELRERLILVAVDTSLRACLHAGVDPDFVVMVDPQYWNTRHLDGCGDSRAVVISESSVFPRSLHVLGGPLCFCSSLFPLGQFFEERIGAKGVLGAGGSVATSAWDFLRHLGCTEIFLAGLDLSFPGGQTHFHGSVFEEATHRDACRLRPAATPRYSYLWGANSYLVPDDRGGQVLSDQRMDVYAHWFENQFRQHPETVNRRIGTGSRQLAGLGYASLQDCLDLPVRRPLFDQLLRSFRHVDGQGGDPGPVRSRLGSARQELLSQLTALGDLVDQAGQIIARIRAGLLDNATGFAELDQIDSQLSGFADNRIIGFLVERLIQELSTAAPPQTLDEAIDRSKLLYSALADACAYHLRLFAVEDAKVG